MASQNVIEEGSSTNSLSINKIKSPNIHKGAEATMAVQASLGEAVFLLARDVKWRHLSLMDIEWLLLPVIAANQFMTVRGRVKNKDGEDIGVTIPLGIALWARVSEEVDKKLRAQKESEAPLRMAPSDWTSGDISWLLLTVGPEAVQASLHKKVHTLLGGEMMEFET